MTTPTYDPKRAASLSRRSKRSPRPRLRTRSAEGATSYSPDAVFSGRPT
jgi:hypothetical protein